MSTSEGRVNRLTRAVALMCANAGLNQSDVSRRMGRTRVYLANSLARSADMRLSTLCEVARACGFRLELVGDGLTIDLTDHGSAAEGDDATD